MEVIATATMGRSGWHGMVVMVTRVRRGAVPGVMPMRVDVFGGDLLEGAAIAIEQRVVGRRRRGALVEQRQ